MFSLLLRARFRSSQRGPSWRDAISSARGQLLEHLDDNPSLKSKLPEAIPSAFRFARRAIVDESGADDGTLPVVCPWTFEQIIHEGGVVD
jgi:hypothetical protein